ncbi:Deoxynucleotidyltransferase terminal-interacting protein 1 [Trichinella nativa]|uniref:Deoxynucleotidyltransferase terminal-interacting protein 1 n=1 Tax=Trichinella nativa TaxID=6335 RepID=A0A0V1LLI9_9BILA|nr:Deoxynucleotidyltransferase terminal-interacting protein 1 [Trichinella sp. T6]KRZ60236.1 Deoxynucleotidyltransferase terminal-interacting protein 1 [Trichinella nativa]
MDNLMVAKADPSSIKDSVMALLNLFTPYNKRLKILKSWRNHGKFNPRDYSRFLVDRLGNEYDLAKSGLSALRALIQVNINAELKGIIQRYAEKYFAPAIRNISGNMEGISSERLLHGICREVLEEAKHLYPAVTAEKLATNEKGTRFFNLNQIHRGHLKHLFVEANSEDGSSSDSLEVESMYEFHPRTVTPIAGYYNSKRMKPSDSKHFVEKMNPDRLVDESLFVLGTAANIALGYSGQRGRIYSKFPWLFKYIGDSEDRLWLVNCKLRRKANGGKVIFILLEDLLEIVSLPEFSVECKTAVRQLESFCVPSWLLEKMKHQMAEMKALDGPIPAT